jgi:ADP-ribosylglycohydrolase
MIKPGQWTDDTSMGLCLADTLIERKGLFCPIDLQNKFMMWWYCSYNNGFRNEEIKRTSVGLGRSISKSLDAYFLTIEDVTT